MGATEYLAARSSEITQGKVDTLATITSIHTVQRKILQLRQTAQVERLKEASAALRKTMEENVAALSNLEGSFNAVVKAIESLPTSFAEVDTAEAKLEAAVGSTGP